MTSFRTCVACLCAVSGLLVASPASAQATAKPSAPTPKPFWSDRITVGVNLGVQASSGDFTQHITPLIYDEPASMDIAQNYESGALFDIGGSYLFMGNFGASLSYSHTGGDGAAAVSALIPDPLHFDNLRPASTAADGLNHSENAVHLQLFYRFAVSPKLDVSVGIGPTFFSVSQDLIDTVTVTEPTPTIAPVVVEASDSPVGINLGADATYMFNERFGAGVILRYSNASADLTTPSGGALSLDAGGFQFAGGLRVRF